MTLSTKRLRKLEFNGLQFGWLIRRKPTWSQGHKSPMTLAIQALDFDNPTVLHVTLNISRPDNFFKEHQAQITPSIIRSIIEQAIDEGWKCDIGGAAYEFNFKIVEARRA